jgi:hypoxanthine phosphoribosyltransferase
MKKIYLEWSGLQCHVQDLARQIMQSSWEPDYIVGITRGGLIPATLLSQYLDKPMHALSVSLRDHGICESNLGMAEDAFGYHRVDLPELPTSNPHLRKRILIVDDINDSGATINWIQQDWQASCMPNDPAWQEIWTDNVRFAVVVNNEASQSSIELSYVAATINKLENPVWVVFPWESWWQQRS